MTDRNPDVPQSDDATLVADLIRLLRILGPIGRLNVADVIVPVVNMGDVVERSITAMPAAFASENFFTEGTQVTAAANLVHADTGQLVAGVYDLIVDATTNSGGSAGTTDWLIQHRNAANKANVTEIPMVFRADRRNILKYAYTFADNERLRVILGGGTAVGERSAAWILARRRT